jgi:hypothetical protein
MDGAYCKGKDVNIFYVDEDNYSAVAYAKSLCNKCSIITLCRSEAMSKDEVGIWGGMTFTERESFRLTSYLREKRASFLQRSTQHDTERPAYASPFSPSHKTYPTIHIQPVLYLEIARHTPIHIVWPD